MGGGGGGMGILGCIGCGPAARNAGGGGPPVLPPAGSPGQSGYLVAAPAPSTAALSADARPPAAFSKCAAAPRGGAKGSPHSAAAQHVLQAR